MPTKAAVREILPPNRVIWRQQIFALEHLARVAQRQGHDLAALVPFATDGAIAPMSVGSMSARIGSPLSPGAMISSQSTTLRSWRTLPGQS